MTSSDETDAVYWRSYVKAITQVLGPAQPGSSRVVFVASQHNRGIAASRFIPMAVSNELLYQVSNSLLDPSSVFYSPSSSGSVGYFQSLRSYLNYVVVGGDNSPGAAKREQDAREEMAAAQDDFTTQESAAWTRYNADPNPHKPDFTVWVRTHATRYTSARQRLQAAGAAWRQALRDKAGPMGDEYFQDTQVFDGYTGIDHKVPGMTMPCQNRQILDVNTAIEKSKSTQSGNAVEEPTEAECFWRPEYAIDPLYRSTMDTWAWEYDRSPSQSIAITLSQGQQTSWTNYGHSEAKGNAGVSFFGLFRIGGGHGESTTWKRVESNWSSNSVTFELTFKKMALFNVNAGSWEIPDIRHKYPVTRSDIPVQTRDLVRPTQLLCASGTGLNVTISGNARHDFNSHYESTKSSSGSAGVSIGCFGFSGSVGVTNTTGNDTHVANWNGTTGKLTFTPTPFAGTCTLLGVVGERLSE